LQDDNDWIEWDKKYGPFDYPTDVNFDPVRVELPADFDHAAAVAEFAAVPEDRILRL
jgi:hypothetical protein